MTITAESLSRKFAQLVLSLLNEEDKAQVLAHPKEDSCCLTHDFMDTNQVMLDAYQELTGEELDIQDGDSMNLINTAWALARVNDWWV